MSEPAKTLLAALEGSSLFQGLDGSVLERIAGMSTRRTFRADELIVRAGDPADECYIVLSGSAAVLGQDLLGQEIRLATVEPGDSIGEIALLRRGSRTASVRALTSVEVCVITRSLFDEVLSSFPQVTEVVSRGVGLRELRTFLRQSSPFAHLPAEVLLRLADRLKIRCAAVGDIVIREGEPGDELFMIRLGRVDITLRGRRKRQLEAGDCFGEVALLSGGRRTTTVTALEECEFLVLAKNDFEAILEKFPEMAAHFAELRRIRFPSAPGQSIELPDPISTLMPFARMGQRRNYWKILLIGGGFTLLLSALALAQDDAKLAKLAILIGTFVGPVTFVVYAAESSWLRNRRLIIALAFALGGLVSIPIALALGEITGLAASLKASEHISLAQAFLIGLTEETAKVLPVLLFLGARSRRFQIDGLILGVAVGMGFAALESLGYALRPLAEGKIGPSLGVLWLRGLVTPFAHGTWTAIICGAIWREKERAGRNVLGNIALAFVISVCLHALWDWDLVSPGKETDSFLMLSLIIGLRVLRQTAKDALQDQGYSILALNPGIAEAIARHPGVSCRVCSQTGFPGARYCPRCGAVLRRSSAVEGFWPRLAGSWPDHRT